MLLTRVLRKGHESGVHRCDTYLYEHIIQTVLLLFPTGFEELSPLRGELDPRSNHADSLLETVTSTNTEFMPHIPVSCPEQIMELAHAKFGEIQW
jgi:hypothetical protein